MTAIRSAREKLGLTQADYWGAIGVTQSCGSRYENDLRSIPRPVLLLLAIAYGRDWQAVVRTLRAKKR